MHFTSILKLILISFFYILGSHNRRAEKKTITPSPMSQADDRSNQSKELYRLLRTMRSDPAMKRQISQESDPWTKFDQDLLYCLHSLSRNRN